MNKQTIKVNLLERRKLPNYYFYVIFLMVLGDIRYFCSLVNMLPRDTFLKTYISCPPIVRLFIDNCPEK